MSHTIELPEVLESRLEAEAEREGITATEVILRIVQRKFATPSLEEQKLLNEDSVALLKSWLREVPVTPEEKAAAEEDLKEFKRSINQSRAELGQKPAYSEAE